MPCTSGIWICFNSTLVQLKVAGYLLQAFPEAGFNSTLVQLKVKSN